jgi:hypothetical protein
VRLEPGIYPNIPMAAYVADCAQEPSLSASVAHTIIARSSLHAWYSHPRLNPNWSEEESGDFDLGSAAHACLLENDWAKLAVYDGKDWRKKEAQEFREQARGAGKIPVLTRQHTAIEAMVVTARNHLERLPDTKDIYKGALVENTLIWREGRSWCRCRPDLIRADRRLILSYKTTGNAEPDAFIRGPLVGMGYDLQAAQEVAGNTATGGHERPHYVWLVQEIEPPYACSFVGYGPQMQEYAISTRGLARGIWEANIATNKWSGYRNEIHWAELPAWRAANLEQLLELASI